MDEQLFVSSAHSLKDIGEISSFWLLQVNLYEESYAGFCVNISLCFFEMNAQEDTSGSYGNSMFSFTRNC